MRIQVCNREGTCVPVKFHIREKNGSIDIYSDEVTSFTDDILAADDELWRDNEGDWQDNFDLEKLRSRQNRGE